MGAALREAWLWLVLAFLLGLVIGWFARARFAGSPTPSGGASTGAPAPASVASPPAAPVAAAVAAPVATAPASAAESAPAAKTPAERKPVQAKAPAAKPAAAKSPAPSKIAAAKTAATKAPAARKPAAPKAAPVLDLAAAKAAIGVTVKLDDLKLIEGIGPKIEGLFKADGLTTWRELSKANVERLQGILDAAGPRYKAHDPASWPTQAGLLADGKFDEFKKLTDSLKGGR